MGLNEGIGFAVWGLVAAAMIMGLVDLNPAVQGLLLFMFIGGGLALGLAKG